MKSPLLIALLMLLPLLVPAQSEGMPYTVEGKKKDDGYFYLYAKRKKSKTIELDKLGLPARKVSSNLLQQPLPERMELEENMWAPPIQYDLIGYYSQDSVIYALVAFAGEIALYEFQVGKNNVKDKKTYFVDHHHLISQANGAGVAYSSKMERIDDTLYLYINGGQLYGGKVDALYTFGLLPEDEKQLYKVIIGEPRRRIWMYHVAEKDRNYYKQEKGELAWYEQKIEDEKRKKKKKSLEESLSRKKEWVSVVEEHLAQPYYYLEVSNDKEEREVEKRRWLHNRLTPYNPFDGCDFSLSVDNPFDFDSIRPYLKEVLAYAESIYDAEPITYFLLGNRSEIGFFYKHNGELKLLKYHLGQQEWHLLDYTQEVSQPRQLWFKASDKKK
ncbi:hypothetical protein [Dysgonomonas sp. 25]|uniref:hypothetical protein n=1 Tax=Dysgonomonas sp. 25 TaxID=2302933 RepID=UPI0013D4F515|nr:hypothetical protein [Dysgonomonas sp. 25]NDV69166.1 hypothetical protein [Dysgonomonas sp. 25]